MPDEAAAKLNEREERRRNVSQAAETVDSPVSVEALDERIAWIQSEVGKIQAQLSDRNRLNDRGERVSSHEFWDWKRRATYAMAKLNEEARALKAQRTAIQRASNGTPRPAAVYGILRRALGKIGTGDYCLDPACQCAEMARASLREAWAVEHVEPERT